MVITTSEQLDAIWQKWLVDNAYNEKNRYHQSYRYTYRNSFAARHFESWLFENGAFVKQEHNKRYLTFLTEKQATWFILQWL
jgi:hypothetical protein